MIMIIIIVIIDNNILIFDFMPLIALLKQSMYQMVTVFNETSLKIYTLQSFVTFEVCDLVL